MLTATDFMEDNDREHILNIAPGEGSKPLSAFRDKYSEELAYPDIFLGQKRPDNVNKLTDVYYCEICKSKTVMTVWTAMCVENIFFETKKL